MLTCHSCKVWFWPYAVVRRDTLWCDSGKSRGAGNSSGAGKMGVLRESQDCDWLNGQLCIHSFAVSNSRSQGVGLTSLTLLPPFLRIDVDRTAKRAPNSLSDLVREKDWRGGGNFHS